MMSKEKPARVHVHLEFAIDRMDMGEGRTSRLDNFSYRWKSANRVHVY